MNFPCASIYDDEGVIILNWAENIQKAIKAHEILAQEIELALNESISELEGLGLAARYEYLTLHPLEWKVSINNKEVIMTKKNVLDYKEQHEAGRFVNYDGDTKQAVQKFLENRFA